MGNYSETELRLGLCTCDKCDIVSLGLTLLHACLQMLQVYCQQCDMSVYSCCVFNNPTYLFYKCCLFNMTQCRNAKTTTTITRHVALLSVLFLCLTARLVCLQLLCIEQCDMLVYICHAFISAMCLFTSGFLFNCTTCVCLYLCVQQCDMSICNGCVLSCATYLFIVDAYLKVRYVRLYIVVACLTVIHVYL